MFIGENYRHVRRHSSKLLNFLPTEDDGNEKYGCAKLLDGLRDDVVRISTVHAVRRIFRKTSKVLERLLLFIGLIAALFMFSYITRKILYICRHKPLQTVIADLHLPVYKIPFPEVTICNQNRLNWQRYNEAKDKFLRQQHHNPQHELIFREVVNAYDTLRFGRFDNFKNLTNLYTPLLLSELNYINFTLVVQLMAWRCHEIFTECYWRNHLLDCCEIFSERNSQKGQCLAFNTIESAEGQRKQNEDPYYPWRTMGRGPKHGLRVRIHVREGLHSPFSQRGGKGVLVMLVEPNVWAYLHYDIPTNTRATIAVSAYLQYNDNNTRIYSPDVRNCVFQDELESAFYKSLPNHKYMYENCLSQCQQEHLMKYCNCTVDLFYPPGPYRACQLTDLPCLYEHNEVLQYFELVGEHEYVRFHDGGINCPCHATCRSLTYFNDHHVDHKSKSNLDINNTEIEMAVFFVWETIMVYRTTAVYPLIDLMASLGGLAGLCFGCSLIGITEILYFFFFDVPKQACLSTKDLSRLRVKRESLRTKHIFVRQRTISKP